MVGLRAKVLGRLGRTTSPQPRACALSCPSLVVYQTGALGSRPYHWPRCCLTLPRARPSLCPGLNSLGRVTPGLLDGSITVKRGNGIHSCRPYPRLLSGRAEPLPPGVAFASLDPLPCGGSGRILVGAWRRAGFTGSAPALCRERRLPENLDKNGGASRRRRLCLGKSAMYHAP